MLELAGACLDPEGYAVLVARCPKDGHEYPPSYEAWQDLVARATAEAASHGLASPPIPIEAEAFLGWCGRAGVLPCLRALRVYLALKRRGWDSGIPAWASCGRPRLPPAAFETPQAAEAATLGSAG